MIIFAAMPLLGRVCAEQGVDTLGRAWIVMLDAIKGGPPDVDGASANIREILALARVEPWLVVVLPASRRSH